MLKFLRKIHNIGNGKRPYGTITIPSPILKIWAEHGFDYVETTMDPSSLSLFIRPYRQGDDVE